MQSNAFEQLVTLDFEKAINQIKASHKRDRDTITRLQEELHKAKDEAYASEEMQKLLKENRKLHIEHNLGFHMTLKECNAVSDWKMHHDTVEHGNPEFYHGAIGGGYTYEFYPTAIGTSGVCVCDRCRRAAYNAAYKKGSFNKNEWDRVMKEHNGVFEFQELG